MRTADVLRKTPGLLTASGYLLPLDPATGLPIIPKIGEVVYNIGTELLDPFSGVGTTGLVCSDYGLRSLLVELEPRFVEMARANIALNFARWERLGKPVPQVIQGDSTRLLELLAEHVLAAVSSVLTSPPYADGGVRKNRDRHPERMKGTEMLSYKAAINSPPFTLAASGGDIYQHGYEGEHGDHHLGTHYRADNVGLSEGNIARLPIGALTSPPYENSVHGNDTTDAYRRRKVERLAAGEFSAKRLSSWIPSNTTPSSQAMMSPTYGQEQGQIGHLAGGTYWGAIARVLSQLYQLLPEGGHVAWIVKPFVRKKQIVDLPAMTLELMVSQGWEPVTWIDAMLVAQVSQPGLLPGTPTQRKEYKSFFRRQLELKYPDSAINAEVVLVVRKPVD